MLPGEARWLCGNWERPVAPVRFPRQIDPRAGTRESSFVAGDGSPRAIESLSSGHASNRHIQVAGCYPVGGEWYVAAAHSRAVPSLAESAIAKVFAFRDSGQLRHRRKAGQGRPATGTAESRGYACGSHAIRWGGTLRAGGSRSGELPSHWRSEEHTSELQSLRHLVCRLLLEK